jgi:hypothetical protein
MASYNVKVLKVRFRSYFLDNYFGLSDRRAPPDQAKSDGNSVGVLDWVLRCHLGPMATASL